jgi:hypothetical protein
MKKTYFNRLATVFYVLFVLTACRINKVHSGVVLDFETKLPIHNVDYSSSKDFRDPTNKATTINGEFTIDSLFTQRERTRKIVFYNEEYGIKFFKIRKNHEFDTVYMTKRKLIPGVGCYNIEPNPTSECILK